VKVRIYDYVAGMECYRGTCELSEAVPEQGERNRAHAYLALVGRYWVGGGAVPLVLLMNAHEEAP
jgi:hypothetical protein